MSVFIYHTIDGVCPHCELVWSVQGAVELLIAAMHPCSMDTVLDTECGPAPERHEGVVIYF